MKKKNIVNGSKFFAIALIIVLIIGLLISKIYSAQDNTNYYTLTVVNDSASYANDRLSISEKIVSSDEENLNYEVTLKNVNGLKSGINSEANSYENKIAFLIDTSYSMNKNDPDHKSRAMAAELAKKTLEQVNNASISVSTNNSTKLALNNDATTVSNQINNLSYGDVLQGDAGLQNAYSTIQQGESSDTKKVNKYIVVFTDSTDWVKDKMKEYADADKDLRFITILFNFTSSSYIENSKPIYGDIYYMDIDNVSDANTDTNTDTDTNTTSDSSISLPEGTEKYSAEKIIDGINNSVKDITISNVFSDEIKENFTIDSFSIDTDSISKTENKALIKTSDDVTQTSDGYSWKIAKLVSGDSLKLKFHMKLNKSKVIDASNILIDIFTNKEQNLTYTYINLENGTSGTNVYHENETMNGLDSRQDNSTSKKATVIEISYGYEINIEAVNETNDTIKVPNLKLHVVARKVGNVDQYGNRTYGDTVLDKEYNANDSKTFKYKTDSNGKVIIGMSDSTAMRDAGTIEYTITPIVDESTNVGYSTTEPIVFDVNNDAEQRLLFADNHGASDDVYSAKADSNTRVVNVKFAVKCKTSDFEIKTVEKNKTNNVVAGAEYELYAPKVNISDELKVYKGTADDNGILHFSPAVMTTDGTYVYTLKQISTSSTYTVAPTSTIFVTYQNAKIVKTTTTPRVELSNNQVTAEVQDDADNHLLITVQNENQNKDPFNFKLSLKDETDSTPIDGVTYLIETYDSNAKAIDHKYLTTGSADDSGNVVSGEINTQLHGTGYVKVKITEQSPKTGYQADSTVKTAVLNIQNGEITIIDQNGTSGYNYQDRNTRSTDTGLKLDLTSKKKAEQNIVDVTLLDKDETDVNIGRNVVYHLIDVAEDKDLGTAVSDRNGHLKFTIDGKAQGQYVYSLRVDQGSIPNGYDVSKVEEDAKFNIEFDSNGYICGTSDIGTTVDTHSSTVSGEQTTEYTAFVTIYYELEQGNIAELKIQLAEETSRQAISGAQYDITIEYGDGSNSRIIKGRKTNSSGIITTHLRKSSGVEATITITESAAALGYVCDSTTEEANIVFLNNGSIKIQAQSPYDRGATYTKDPDLGMYIDNNGAIVYQHKNKKRTAADTYLNLTLNYTDTNGGIAGAKTIGFQSHSGSDTTGNLVDENGNELTYNTFNIELGSQGANSLGQAIVDYQRYANKESGFTHYIKVPGISETTTTDEERFTYLLDIAELTDHGAQATPRYTANEKTKVTMRFVFTKRDGRVALTAVETEYGNRLVKHKEFSSAGDSKLKEDEDKLGVFMGNATLDLYTDYDEVGNLSLDLKKMDKNGESLNGAQYTVRVVNSNPPSTYKYTVPVTNGDSSSDIELTGLTVSEGSHIYIEEKTAPIGYAINDRTETLEVKEISDDGVITLQQVDQAYKENRLKLKQLASTQITSQTMKSNYEVGLIDYQLDTFNFGITALDSTEQTQGVSGYNFKVETSMGATGNVITGDNGEGTSKIGGNGTDRTITYTVSAQKPANYYKPMASSIKVNVVFNATGQVDNASTLASGTQTDPNYGKTWKITDIDTSENAGIKIQILVDHQDPLKVKINTLDKITNAKVSDVEYKIAPSVVLDGTGSNSIDVGYALESGTIKYTLTQTSISNSYASIKDKTFSIDYANEKINSIAATDIENDVGKVVKTGDKEVTITIYVEPKVPFEITNLYYFDQNTKLQGSNFEVTCLKDPNTAIKDQDKVGTGTTDSNGVAVIYSGLLGTSEDIIYKVHQSLGATGYATIDDFYVKVTYNDSREITGAKLVDKNGEDITNSKFVTNVSFTKDNTKYNKNDKGIVNITVLNYPEFKINITDVDRRNSTTPIAGTTYSVVSEYTNSDSSISQFNSASGIVTDSNGLGVAHLNNTKSNTIVTYIIKEEIPATNYQTLGTDKDQINENKIRVKVTFDSEGYVSKVELVDSDKFGKIAETSKIETISDPKDNFIVNLQLKNNPILKVNISVKDSADHTKSLGSGIGFTIIGKEENTTYTNSSKTNKVNQTNTPEEFETNSNGITSGYVDRTLDNKQMTYEIAETKKPAGYEWATDDHNLSLSATFDADGKLSTVVANGNVIEVISFDAEEFVINVNIYNEEVKQFGINLVAEDTYNKDKKIDNVQVNAFLVKDGDTSYTEPDPDYNLMDSNEKQLISGADRDNNGTPDIAHGEDYEYMGQYSTGKAETRTLRLVVLNDSNNGNAKGYYLDSKDGSNSGKNIGHYLGNQYYDDAYYQRVEYSYLISVTFDDEGKITDAKLNTGLNTNVGWLVDNRYIQTADDGVTIDHTSYKLNIVMKFFPMLDLKINAMDNYTYNDEITKDGEPIALNGSKYTVTTLRHNPGPRGLDELVTAGYIGYGNSYGINGTLAQAAPYEATDELFVPIETNHTRLFYVFEEQEPTNYQKYTDKYVTDYNQKLVAIIQVTFDDKGEIDYDNSIVRKVTNDDGTETTVHPYTAEDKTTYLSGNNIKEYNYWYDKKDSNRNINFYIGYALTTTINITAIDDISGTAISNIRMYPFINSEAYGTKEDYLKWNDVGYRDTDSKGQTYEKYWGAAEDNSLNNYVIGSSRIGSNYNGYFFPSDMADSYIGGSGNEKDYYAKLDVTYGADGKISNVKSIGSDLWGDDNLSNITFDKTTGNIYINMIYSRKFQMTLNKADYYDHTINNLSATFDVTSNQGLNTHIDSRKMTPIGKIYKGKQVKYTLSETMVPSNYFPLPSTLEFYVTFDENGNITLKDIKSDKDQKAGKNDRYFEAISVSDKTENINKTKPDLTFNIYDKPAFIINAHVIDKFYKDDGLEGAYLQVTSDKNNEQASGNPQTDNNGYATILAGPVYPSETVTYSIKQTNTINGYYANNTVIKLQVKYNENGKIEAYKIIDGNDAIYNFDGASYMNTRNIDMQIMNMPKDIKIGLNKFDQTTNEAMAGVKFTVTKTNTSTGVSSTNNLVTEDDGNVVAIIDTFTTGEKTIKYVIHEVDTPATYRKTEDIAFTISYAADGSMFAYNQVMNDNQILNTNAKTTAATRGKIQELDNERIHIKSVIPNDNAYDVIIKNEDTNLAGLGIEGTQYDVKINDQTYTPSLTDSNGQTTIEKLTQSGQLTISVAEHKVGEGYRENIDNKATIIVDKGTSDYSLKLNNATDGYTDDSHATTANATIEVDEEHGKITITFKNETKNELTLIKQDRDTKALLKNAEFTVTKQQIDNAGANIGDETTLTTDANKLTDSDGKLYFDLGVAPQSQIWKYTFTEVNPPEKTDNSGDKYNLIVPVVMTVKYDQYGRISEQTSSKASRLTTIMADDNINCRSMYAIINNGDISPAYTIKVVTEDEDTNRRINGSDIYLHVTNVETGETLKIDKKTEGAIPNGTNKLTGNLATDGKIYTDEELESSNEDGGSSIPPIIEKGLVYTDPIDFQGTIDIEVSQQGVANGYEVDAKQTSVGNNHIKLTATYEAQQVGDDPVVKFTNLDNAGFDVQTDETNRIIKITIKNRTKIMFHITTEAYGTKPLQPLQGVQYDIIAKIVNSVDYTDTDVNVTTPASDAEGKTEKAAGKSFAGKTVIYTLHQHEVPSDYNVIDDIEVEVTYDSRGNIRWAEILTSESLVSIDENQTKGKEIYLNVLNKKHIPQGYTITLEKRALDTDDDENAYGTKLEGAKYKITVDQENVAGENPISWEGITDKDGWIVGNKLLKGTGYITITIEEEEAPDGYQKDATVKTFKGYRDPDTGAISFDESDVNKQIINTKEEGENTKETAEGTVYRPKHYENDNPEVYIIPVNPQLDGKFSIAVNKVVAGTKQYITESSAKFSAVLQKTDDQGNVTYTYPIDDFSTDNTGRARVSNKDLPTEEGTYQLLINELQAPDGYTKLKKPAVFDVEVGKDSVGNPIITNVKTETTGYASTTKCTKQLIGVTIENEIELKENEFSLDITKVARKTGEPIDSMAIFKVQLPDAKDTAVYTETKETQLGKGKLDYCYIEQDKDYTVRLTHMAIPKEEGTYEYVFKEVTPPEGYRKIDEDLKLDITFMKQSTVNKMKEQEKNDGNNIINDITSETLNNTTDNTSNSDEEDKMVITKVESSNENYMKWYYNGEDGQSFDITKPIKIDILDDIDKDEYTIHYDDNVADEEITVPEDQTKVEDTDINLSEDNPTREGYIFEGWALSPTATKADYKPRDTYKLNQPATLYAVWEEKLYLRSTKYLIDDGTNAKSKDNFWTEGQQSQYDDGDLYIKNIRPQAGSQINPKTRSNVGTTFEEFEENIKDNNADTIEFYIPDKDENGNIIVKQEKEITGDKKVGKTWQNKKWTTPMYDGNEETNLVATGMIVRLTKGDDQVIQLTLIVKGDIFPYCYKDSDGNENYTSYCIGNGKADLADNTKYGKILTRNLKKPTFFSEIEKQAIDYYMDADQGFSLNRDSLRYMYKKKNASITLLDN